MKEKVMAHRLLPAFKYSMLAGFCLATFASPARAAETLSEALTAGKVSLQLRYRCEGVDQEGFTEKAFASTLRTQLGYATDAWHGLGPSCNSRTYTWSAMSATTARSMDSLNTR